MVALVLLKQEGSSKPSNDPPAFVRAARAAEKVKRRISAAERIRRSKGHLNPAQRAIIRELKKTKTNLRSYIATWRDRVEVLTKRAESLKEKQEKRSLREKYAKNLAKRTIEEQESRPDLNPVEVERYFTDFYSAGSENRPESPFFNEWIKRLREH